jgi:glycosyltransferase involved in cell wall biosynthesis
MLRTMASLLAQTEPADIMIVDDGSQPPIEKPASSGAVDITLLRLEKNQGITGALNHGLASIGERYEYVARMDCGDLCAPARIGLQQKYMDAHPDIDLLGALADIVDEDGAHLFVEGTGSGAYNIRRKLYDNSAFKHPTFFFRTQALRRLATYSADYPHAEDYEILYRFATRGQVACLDDVLVVYEKTDAGLSNSNRRAQLKSRLAIQLKYFEPLKAVAYIGVLRTLATLTVPARGWAKLSRLYWQSRGHPRVPVRSH